MAHVAPWKKTEVANLVKLIKDSKVVAVANVDGIPSAQMQQMRKALRDEQAGVKVSKNTLLTLALKEAAGSKPGADDLITNLDGSTALITTEMSPFKLFKTLEAAKTKAPARGGEVAPDDIKVAKGETPFKPGPIVGDLQKAGIPAKIDNGKVMITKDITLVKKGDRIPQEAAQMLTRLEIHPLTVGMDLRAAFGDGTVYGADALSVDYIGQVAGGHGQAINLAVQLGWATKVTINPLLALANGRMLAIAKAALDKDAASLDDDLKAAVENAGAAAAAAPAAAAAEEKKEEEEEEEEAVSEEDAMGGLGSLFG